MYFDCHTASWYKSAPSHAQTVQNFRPLSYMKGELIYQISTSSITMRQGHSDTTLIISITYWKSHTGNDKMESKKCRVEGTKSSFLLEAVLSPAPEEVSNYFGHFLKNWRTQILHALQSTMCFEVRML